MDESLVGVTLEGRYRIDAQLGEGGAAVVYDALDLKTGRGVAVKLVRPKHRRYADVVQRFLREGRIAASLVHPNICAVSDTGTLADGSPFLVLERLEGVSLVQRLANGGALGVRSALELGAQLASAIASAHRVGIVHRDVKPANVFLASVLGLAPVAKLLDFGSALITGGGVPKDELPITRSGTIIGTPMYMAPEQALGEELDERVDIYALGALLYESIAGRRPFLARDSNTFLRELLTSTAPGLASVSSAPAAACAVVDRAMSRAREDRHATAYALLEDLSSLLNGTIGNEV